MLRHRLSVVVGNSKEGIADSGNGEDFCLHLADWRTSSHSVEGKGREMMDEESEGREEG
jgi:hypothetical protein